MEEVRKQSISSGSEPEGTAEGKGASGERAASAGTEGRGTSGRGSRRAASSEGKEQSAEALGLSQVEEEAKPADIPVIVPTMTAEEKKKEQARIRAKKARERKKAEKLAAEAAKPAETFNAQQLATLLVTLSGVLAARPGCQHWQLSEMEAKQIVEPLCNIIKNSTNIADLGKYADHIALTIACVTIILPRAIITLQQMAQKKKAEKEVMKVVKTGAITTDNGRDGREHHKELAGDENGTSNVLAELATAGY